MNQSDDWGMDSQPKVQQPKTIISPQPEALRGRNRRGQTQAQETAEPKQTEKASQKDDQWITDQNKKPQEGEKLSPGNGRGRSRGEIVEPTINIKVEEQVSEVIHPDNAEIAPQEPPNQDDSWRSDKKEGKKEEHRKEEPEAEATRTRGNRNRNNDQQGFTHNRFGNQEQGEQEGPRRGNRGNPNRDYNRPDNEGGGYKNYNRGQQAGGYNRERNFNRNDRNEQNQNPEGNMYGRGEGRGRGGFRGGRGGRGGFNRDRNDRDRNDRNYNGNQSEETAQPKKETVEAGAPANLRRAWPCCQMFVFGRKLAVTLRKVQQFNCKILLVPYRNLKFDYYPGNFVLSSSVGYRDKIMKKEDCEKGGSVYFQKAIGLEKYEAVVFLKIDESNKEQSLEQGIDLVMRHAQMVKSEKPLDSIVFPLSKDLCRPEKVISVFAKCLESYKAIKQVYITTNEPSIFEQSVADFSKYISFTIQQNELSFD